MLVHEILMWSRTRRARQVSCLYAGMIAGVGLGVATSVVNTQLLGPDGYGDLKFIQNMFIFGATVLTLGLFVSGGRLIALEAAEVRRKELVGTMFILGAVVSLVLVVGMVMSSFVQEDIFDNELGGIIRLCTPLLFVFPFRLCMERVLQGENRIYELSLFRILPQALYLGGALAFNYFVPLTLSAALLLQLGFLGTVALGFVVVSRPKVTNLVGRIRDVLRANRTHGFQVYVGVLAGVATSQLAGFSIAFFRTNTDVGFFALAVTLTAPLTMIPNVVGTTFYREFAHRDALPQRATFLTAVVTLCSWAGFMVLVKPVVLLLYSDKYTAVIALAYITAVGSVLYGFGDYYNRFIGAHGLGKYNRNGALVVGISNMGGYLLLVHLFGAEGAAVTHVISGGLYLALMKYYYGRATLGLRGGA